MFFDISISRPFTGTLNRLPKYYCTSYLDCQGESRQTAAVCLAKISRDEENQKILRANHGTEVLVSLSTALTKWSKYKYFANKSTIYWIIKLFHYCVNFVGNWNGPYLIEEEGQMYFAFFWPRNRDRGRPTIDTCLRAIAPRGELFNYLLLSSLLYIHNLTILLWFII